MLLEKENPKKKIVTEYVNFIKSVATEQVSHAVIILNTRKTGSGIFLEILFCLYSQYCLQAPEILTGE